MDNINITYVHQLVSYKTFRRAPEHIFYQIFLLFYEILLSYWIMFLEVTGVTEGRWDSSTYI